ncbi:unnamed protein product [Withania somnifera]
MQKHNTNIHLFMILLILVGLPLSSYSSHIEKYAAIFDAGSRVHVFRFNPNMELLNIGNDIDRYLAIKPGLSSYAEDPRATANSLKPLPEKAEAVVPKNLESQTPVKIGATAGLRLLKGDSPEKILRAVRDLLKKETTLSYKSALNYLYRNMGKNYSVAYKAAAQQHGPRIRRCKTIIRKALQLDAPCNHKNCSFAGVWNGGCGAGTKNLHVSSFFYDFASAVGIVDPEKSSGISQPIQYYKAAKLAYQDIPYICMDLMYEYTLLVDGFGIEPYRKITVVHEVNYKNHLVGAAWPLGSSIDAVSSTT